MLLEFDWLRGKTFREFTVFLDPVQRLCKRLRWTKQDGDVESTWSLLRQLPAVTDSIPEMGNNTPLDDAG